jgi:hypothetical protein
MARTSVRTAFRAVLAAVNPDAGGYADSNTGANPVR